MVLNSDVLLFLDHPSITKSSNHVVLSKKPCENLIEELTRLAVKLVQFGQQLRKLFSTAGMGLECLTKIKEFFKIKPFLLVVFVQSRMPFFPHKSANSLDYIRQYIFLILLVFAGLQFSFPLSLEFFKLRIFLPFLLSFRLI